MIKRQLTDKLQKLAKQFFSVAILGPRQSGKTTLARATFPDYHYFSLEDFNTQALIKADPLAFLTLHKNSPGIILDEIQNIPELFSYLQVFIDEHKKRGHFILTGSQNFALNEAISQSLAGRIALLTLLPLSIEELKNAKQLPNSVDEILFKGMYPSVYAGPEEPLDWYRSYIRTYVERDVRQIKNITDLTKFQTFIRLCAGRVGQILDLTSLSNDCGISVPTVTQWLSILQASYIIFLLQPYHTNIGKRLIKSPKIFFYDTGLACHLLGITNPEQLFVHHIRGNIFESFMIADFIKQRENKGLEPNLYFWRDKTDYEIDCIIQEPSQLIPVEIKVSQTFNPHLLEHMQKWNTQTKTKPAANILIYGGEQSLTMQQGKLVGWKDAGNLL